MSQSSWASPWGSKNVLEKHFLRNFIWAFYQRELFCLRKCSHVYSWIETNKDLLLKLPEIAFFRTALALRLDDDFRLTIGLFMYRLESDWKMKRQCSRRLLNLQLLQQHGESQTMCRGCIRNRLLRITNPSWLYSTDSHHVEESLNLRYVWIALKYPLCGNDSCWRC